MRFSEHGKNGKLGECITTSRLVGKTCPSDCFFLNNGCYAQQTEKQYGRVVIPFSTANNEITADGAYLMFATAIINGKDVRIHERGDFYLDGKLDTEYLNAIIAGAKRAIKVHGKLPKTWCYTHIYDKAIAKLGKLGIAVYASIHNEEDHKQAKKNGFKLFALVTDIQKRKHPATRHLNAESPKVVHEFGEKFIVCPEQRRGRDKVTCCGTKDTLACKMCVNGLYNVAFMKH